MVEFNKEKSLPRGVWWAIAVNKVEVVGEAGTRLYNHAKIGNPQTVMVQLDES